MRYQTIVLERVEDFIAELTKSDQSRIYSQIDKFGSGDDDSLYIKNLHGRIRELIIKNYRFIFFAEGNCVYFIHCFTKKTNKTPKQEIKLAEKIYKYITRNN